MEEKTPAKAVRANFWQHRSLIWVLGIIIVVLLILGAVGAKWRDHRFGPGMMGRFDNGREFRSFGSGMMTKGQFGMNYNTLSATGTVSAIKDNNLIFIADNGVTQNVIVNASTHLSKAGDTIKLSDLKVNDKLLVRGFPDSSGIQAVDIQVQ